MATLSFFKQSCQMHVTRIRHIISEPWVCFATFFFFHTDVVASCCLASCACSFRPVRQLSTPNPLIFRCLSCYYSSVHPQDLFYYCEKNQIKTKSNSWLFLSRCCCGQPQSRTLLKDFTMSRLQRSIDFVFLHSYFQMCTEARGAKWNG